MKGGDEGGEGEGAEVDQSLDRTWPLSKQIGMMSMTQRWAAIDIGKRCSPL